MCIPCPSKHLTEPEKKKEVGCKTHIFWALLMAFFQTAEDHLPPMTVQEVLMSRNLWPQPYFRGGGGLSRFTTKAQVAVIFKYWEHLESW